LLIATIVFVFIVISVAVLTALLAIAVLLVKDFLFPYLSSPHLSDLLTAIDADLSDNTVTALDAILGGSFFAVAGTTTLVLTSKLIERRSLADVGLGRHGLLHDTVLGFGKGAGEALLSVLVVILASLLGVIDPANLGFSNPDWQQFGVFGNLTLALIVTYLIAVCEEIVFRGFLFRILEEGLGSWLALVVSALLFGISDLPNFNDSTLLDVTPQIVEGLMLVAAYMLTRKLWLPIGLHWGWGFLLVALSGGDVVSFMNALGVSGGALHQVLSSLPSLIVGILLLVLAIRRGQIRTPRWMQRKKPTHK
jgi:uncharacterized protein